MKICCKSGSGSQPHGKVPGRKKPERAQVHKKSKMFFKKRVLQLQKWQKMRVLRVSHVLCVLRVLRFKALRSHPGGERHKSLSKEFVIDAYERR